MNDKVVIVKPDNLAGRVATKNGDSFRYPGQNFWVHPVILENGHKTLALSVKDFPVDNDEAANYILGFLQGKVILNLDPTIVYDYQTLLHTSVCPSCGQEIKWSLVRSLINESDKFCRAECCGMDYSMVPESVRVIAMPMAVINKSLEDEDEDEDEDFLKALEAMQ